MPKPPISFASMMGRSSPEGPAHLAGLDPAALHRERARVLERFADLAAPITRVLSVPRSIPLGGSPRVVSELRLRHLAELQAFLEEAEPNPLDALPPAWADPEPESRRARLAAAWEAAATWPPRYGTDRGSTILATVGGRAFLLALAIREHDRAFGLAEALGLLGSVTPTEWARLIRNLYAIHPRQEIAAELAPSGTPARPQDWCRSLHVAAGSEAARAYPQLGELTLSQWRNLCAEGKALELSPEYSAAVQRVRAALEATEDEPAVHQQVDL